MKSIIKSIGIGVIAILLFAGVGFSLNQVDSSAPSGLSASLMLATSTSVGPDINVELFDENSNCSSRVISTTAQAIMLSFDEPLSLPAGIGNVSSSTVSGSVGHIQLASTTVAYDGGLYGCGNVYAYGQVATTTITLSEF